ncbi:MAG TPA: polysaccharide export protein [Leucothrix mucor]|uniref:Polysaccharide export protein n=1 Tax=Leucothrix mucor TaxID=45248 RepID=A0A7V2WU60_LEUMU|nr:polysaccharide export protein [Leucothrix mucor]
MSMICMKKYFQLAVVVLTLFSFSGLLKAETTNTIARGQAVKRLAYMPFGSNIFTGNFATQKHTSVDPNYQLIAGDKVSLHIWGVAEAVQADQVVTVDANGKLFIPKIGTVQAAGVKASNLQSVVKNKLRERYKAGVEVYVNVLTSAPLRVFVTGAVLRPGQYAGSPTDSVISFLQQAGGIDSIRGSYRNIRIMRGNRAVKTVDLYAFLLWGKLPHWKFRDGDTLLVGQQGGTVNVEGEVRGKFSFEFGGRSTRGIEVIKYARPYKKASNVIVSGTRRGKPWSNYISINRFKGTYIMDGDTLRFITDAKLKTMSVRIEGSHLGSSYYSIKRGTRLKELLDYVSVDPNEADIANIYLKRKSVALRQKENLDKSIFRLERAVLTTPAASDTEALIRAKEAGLILQFVKHAKQVKVDGRVVVSDNGHISNIRLEENDVIVIPKKSDVVIISGEVQMPQSIVYASNATVYGYIQRAGGFTERAEKRKIVIVKPNGQVLMGGNLKVSPGDEIMVFPKIDEKIMQFNKDIMAIIFQIATSAKAVGIF